MRRLLYLVSVAGFVSCSTPGQEPKSSEDKAAEMTRELVREMQQQDSLEGLEVDRISADSIE